MSCDRTVFVLSGLAFEAKELERPSSLNLAARASDLTVKSRDLRAIALNDGFRFALPGDGGGDGRAVRM